MSKTDSEIEKEAIKTLEEMVDDPKLAGTEVQEKAADELRRMKREHRRKDGERAVNVLGASGGPIADVVGLANDFDGAMEIYAKEVYGPSAGPVEWRKIKVQFRAMQNIIKKWDAPDGLQENSALIFEMLRESERTGRYYGESQRLERAREQYPQWSKLNDEQLRIKLVERGLSGPVLQAAHAYRVAAQALKAAGLKVTPAAVNAIVQKAILGGKGGSDNFEKALRAAIAAATSLANLDGTYSGDFSGGAHGSCRVTISGTSVSIGFSGSGANRTGGAFTASVSGSGTCNPQTGSFSGKLSGTVKNKYGGSGVGGNFSGKATNNVASGNWSASAENTPVSGTFRANK